MTVSARVSAQRIVHLLDAMPDYAEYGEIQRATENETSYRLALGYVLKAWGDQLLDLAEHQPRTLSRSQAAMVDTLLEGIGEVFQTLNSMQDLGSFRGDAACPDLCESDRKLLELIERAHRIVNQLRQREFSAVWLEKNARPFYRTLCRIEKVLASRNDLLGVQALSVDPNLAGGAGERGERV